MSGRVILKFPFPVSGSDSVGHYWNSSDVCMKAVDLLILICGFGNTEGVPVSIGVKTWGLIRRDWHRGRFGFGQRLRCRFVLRDER